MENDADMEPDSDQGSPCVPNPCTEEGQTVCEADGDGTAECFTPECDEPSSFCRSYEPCDERTHSFPLVERAPGTDCDDGIACTIADHCTVDGRCQGTVTAACAPGGECLSTEPLPAVIDIPTAQLGGAITQNGSPLPIESYNGSTVTFYLVSHDSNTRHELTELSFDGPCCVNCYRLRATMARPLLSIWSRGTLGSAMSSQTCPLMAPAASTTSCRATAAIIRPSPLETMTSSIGGATTAPTTSSGSRTRVIITSMGIAFSALA